MRFHTNVKLFVLGSMKNAVGNLIGVALNLCAAFCSIVILTMLILPIPEHGISFLPSWWKHKLVQHYGEQDGDFLKKIPTESYHVILQPYSWAYIGRKL